MALSTDQLAALRDLTRTGVLSAEQEGAVRAALGGSAKAKGGISQLLVELLGYVGGGLLLGGAALLLGTSWEDLSRVGRVALSGIATVVLVAGGLVIGGGPSAVRTLTRQRERVVATLFALAAATSAVTAGLAVTDHDFAIGSTAGLVAAVAGYVVVPMAIGHLAASAAGVCAVGAWTGELVADTPLAIGVGLFVLGAVWFVVALLGVLRPVPLGLGIGATIALFGAQQPLGDSDTAVWAYALSAAVALVSFVAYLRSRTTVLLVAGVVATTVVVPEAVWDWTDGAVSGGGLLLVAGAALLAASGLGVRLRARTR